MRQWCQTKCFTIASPPPTPASFISENEKNTEEKYLKTYKKPKTNKLADSLFLPYALQRLQNGQLNHQTTDT